jgi:voltage-gated potassium channel
MDETNKRPGIIWQSILVFLIILDGILLFLTVLSPNLKPSTLENMGIFDLAVSIILLIVFIWRIKQNKLTTGEFFRSNWPDIVAFIPIYFISYFILGIAGAGIVIKILIIIKLVALYLFSKKVGHEFIKYQEKTRLVYALAFFLIIFFFCSYIFYLVEHGVNPEVSTFEDSIWFVLQTITTVGYGDIIPVTGIGRLMGVISMFSALVLTSIITSVATFSLIEKFRKGTEALATKTGKAVQTMDEKLNSINKKMDELDKIEEMNKNIEEIKSEIESLKELIKEKK